MASIDTLVGLLDLVASSGGVVDSRIRLQKEAYLISLLGDSNFRTSAFEYHHYGPYSRELSDVLQSAVSAGLLVESKEQPEDGAYVKYSYKLTEGGSEYLADAGAQSHAYERYVSYFSKYHWRALELAATVKFLELDEGIQDRGLAFENAIDLKPQTKKYKADAYAILGAIGV